MRESEAVAYFIDFSLHDISFVTSIALEAGGTIYTDSATTRRCITDEYPSLRTLYFASAEKIGEHMQQERVRVIVYPDYHIRYFRKLEGVRHVQVFHGPNDKVYQYSKDMLDYDMFFICGPHAYRTYKNAFRKPFVFLGNRPKWLWMKKKTTLWECGEVVTRPEKMWPAVERALRDPTLGSPQIEKHFHDTFYKPDGFAARRARDAIFRLIP